jgi:hypothetical protein
LAAFGVELFGDVFWVGVGWGVLLIGGYFTHNLPLPSSPNHATEPSGREPARFFSLDSERALCVTHCVKDLREIFIYDLMARLRSDPVRARRAQTAADNVASLQRRMADGKADRRDMAQAMSEVVTASGFNYGLLIPQIFPRYPISEPLSLIPRPFMFVMTTLSANSVLTLRAGRQIGKCADGDTVVETESHGDMTLSQLFDMGIASS